MDKKTTCLGELRGENITGTAKPGAELSRFTVNLFHLACLYQLDL